MRGYFHVDVKKDLPCLRIMKKDKFSSKFIQPKTDLSTSAIEKFTEDAVNGKIDVIRFVLYFYKNFFCVVVYVKIIHNFL